jgi:hypothetical protein
MNRFKLILLFFLCLAAVGNAQKRDTSFFEITQLIAKEVQTYAEQRKDTNYYNRFNYDTLPKEKDGIYNRLSDAHYKKRYRYIRQLKGKDFPDIYFENFEGQAKSLSDYKSDMTCLIFNYAFCQSCLNATEPLLDSLKAFQANHTIQVITLFADSREDVESFHEKYKAKVTVGFINKERETEHLPSSGTPYIYILDRNRKIVGSFYLNFLDSFSDFKSRIKTVLEP